MKIVLCITDRKCGEFSHSEEIYFLRLIYRWQPGYEAAELCH